VNQPANPQLSQLVHQAVFIPRYDQFHLIFQVQLQFFEQRFLNQIFGIGVGFVVNLFQLGMTSGVFFYEALEFSVSCQ
jgi:hypothetical protein